MLLCMYCDAANGHASLPSHFMHSILHGQVLLLVQLAIPTSTLPASASLVATWVLGLSGIALCGFCLRHAAPFLNSQVAPFLGRASEAGSNGVGAQLLRAPQAALFLVWIYV